MQEAAASDLTLQCGDRTISGTVFFLAIELLSRDKVNQEVMSLVRRPKDILLLLDGFSQWRCALQEDRIIALVGVSNTKWVPIYVNTFLDFATWHIQGTHTLIILHYAGGTGVSWVPSWSGTVRPIPLRGTLVGTAEFEINGEELRVKGRRIGMVGAIMSKSFERG